MQPLLPGPALHPLSHGFGTVRWDISDQTACEDGSTCPVSSTFTDYHFSVPMGCQRVDVAVTKNNNGYEQRMQITSQPPTPQNGWRGELALSDPYVGAAIFDFDVVR